jgi:hypothetical protein
MLEVASELVGDRDWPHQQVRVDMRAQGAGEWGSSLFGSDGIDAVDAVQTGRCQFAIVNPATAIRPALRLRGGTGDELAAIATVPSYDQLGLAVPAGLGLHTLDDLVRAEPALTVSLRGARPNHLVHMVIDDVLKAVGITLGDLRSWGGVVRYDDGLPHGTVRSGLLRDGAIDAIFDEGVYNWVEQAIAAGLRFLAVPDDALARLTAAGYRAGALSRQRYPALQADVPTLDFSGFLVFTRTDAPDATVRSFCEALVARRDRIPWQGGPGLPLKEMCQDTVDAPLPIPFHPAAEKTWRTHGFL